MKKPPKPRKRSKPKPSLTSMTDLELFKHLVAEAEKLYGRRDPDWSIVGVQRDATIPWLDCDDTKKTMIVHLALGTYKTQDQRIHQLAHEAVHALNPRRCWPARQFEEGLATHFSLYGVRYADKQYLTEALSELKGTYRSALNLYREYKSGNKTTIAQIREIKGGFWDLIPDDLEKVGVGRELAVKLCEKVEMHPPAE